MRLDPGCFLRVPPRAAPVREPTLPILQVAGNPVRARWAVRVAGYACDYDREVTSWARWLLGLMPFTRLNAALKLNASA